MVSAIADQGWGGRLCLDERQVADVTIDARLGSLDCDPSFHAGLRQKLNTNPANWPYSILKAQG